MTILRYDGSQLYIGMGNDFQDGLVGQPQELGLKREVEGTQGGRKNRKQASKQKSKPELISKTKPEVPPQTSPLVNSYDYSYYSRPVNDNWHVHKELTKHRPLTIGGILVPLNEDLKSFGPNGNPTGENSLSRRIARGIIDAAGGDIPLNDPVVASDMMAKRTMAFLAGGALGGPRFSGRGAMAGYLLEGARRVFE